MNGPFLSAHRVTRDLRHRLLFACLICACGLTTGCGAAPKPTGNVTVSITSGGEPVPEGSVQLVGSDTGAEQGKGAFGELNDGSAEFRGVEVGNYQVMILPPAPLEPDPTKPSPPRKTYENIPATFHSPLTSTLKAEVTEGNNEFAFELKP